MAWPYEYVVVLFCGLACMSVASRPFQEFGVVTATNGTFRFVGDSLDLYCNITNATLRENSSMLHFERNTFKDAKFFLPDDVETLTTKTIRLRMSNLSVDDNGIYTCFQNTFSGDTRVIGSQIINVDYKPQQVKNITCRVYNWEQMNCTWDLGVKFYHLKYIKVSLAWTIDGDQYDCPNLTHTSCLWNTNKYQHGHQYMMAVDVSTVVDGKQLMIVKSPPFRVETQLYETSGIMTSETEINVHVKIVALVQPAPVINLQASAVNSSCVKLSWQHSALYRKKYFVAECRIAGTEKWNQIILNQDEESKKKFLTVVCGLNPFTNYEFHISVLPYPIETKAPLSQGHKSEWKMVEAKTFEDVPGAAPNICSGCFHEFKCTQNESPRCVQIYWQDLNDKEKHGILTKYNITYASRETAISNSYLLPVTESKLLISTIIKLPTINQNVEITISPATRIGFSRSSSILFLPSVQRKPNVPPSFLVESDKNNEDQDIVFYLSWATLNVDAKTGQRYSNVTIVWCHGIRQEAECRGDIHWVQLSADHVTYELRPGTEKYEQSDYLIGITAEVQSEGQAVSSGIYWSTCTYLRNELPNSSPKNVHESSNHPVNGLIILWDKFKCSEEKSFITEYLVTYCPLHDNGKTCMEEVKSKNVSNTAAEVTLENLKENVRYNVTVTAVSSAGLGPSEPITTVVVKGFFQDQDFKQTVIIVVIITVSLFSLIIFVILLLRPLTKLLVLMRYCKKGKDKIPNSAGLIQPYKQSPAEFSNKVSHGFQNRPLPKTPEEQHYYGSSACMNNHGSNETKDKHSSESYSEESVTSQSNLLSQHAQANHGSQSAIPDKSSIMKDTECRASKATGCTVKEMKPLLGYSTSASPNATSNKVNSSHILKSDSDSARQLDYSTIGYNDYNNDVRIRTQQKPSDKSSSSYVTHSSPESLDNYHHIALNTSRCTSSPDPSVISFSNTNTLPLRGYNMEVPSYPAERTELQTIDHSSSSVLVGQGEILELDQQLCDVKCTPKSATYIQGCQTPSSHFHPAEGTQFNLMPIFHLPLDSFKRYNDSHQYVALSQLECQSSDLPQNNQPMDYSRFTETPQSQGYGDHLESFLHFPPPPTTSPPSPCPGDTHVTTSLSPLSYCYSLQPAQLNSSPDYNFVSDTESIAHIPINNNNDYTPLEEFPRAASINHQSGLYNCITSAKDHEITAQNGLVLKIPPDHDSIYVDNLPMSEAFNEEGHNSSR